MDLQDRIKRAYSADLFMMLERLEDKHMTAQEVLQRKQEQLQQLGELQRRRAYGLEDERDRAFVRTSIGDGEGNALAELVIDHEDDELARLALLGDEGSFHVHAEDVFGKLSFCDDAVHDCLDSTNDFLNSIPNFTRTRRTKMHRPRCRVVVTRLFIMYTFYCVPFYTLLCPVCTCFWKGEGVCALLIG